MSTDESPAAVLEYASQAISYVEGAVGSRPEFDSETLPLVDHYLAQVPPESPDMEALAGAAVGAYFGEVLLRALGGNWLTATQDPGTWKVVLPGGLSVTPVALALAAIRRNEDELDAGFIAPPKMRPVLEDTLERMGNVSEDEYYSLCGRYDTIEHLQSVLLAVAVEAAAKRN